MITHVRADLPKVWQPDLGYLDLQQKQTEKGIAQPTRLSRFLNGFANSQRRLPDPMSLAMRAASSKNPTVTVEQCADIIAREPKSCTTPWMTARSSWLLAG